MKELKEVILNTLEEVQNDLKSDEAFKKDLEMEKTSQFDNNIFKKILIPKKEDKNNEEASIVSDEEVFLNNLKERLLVLFEGFNSPNNNNLDIKIDLTMSFLEFLLAKTDERLNNIKSSKK